MTLFFKLLIFSIFTQIYGAKHSMTVWDKDVTKHKLRRFLKMTQLIHMDTEVKLKHIQKYIDMHVGTLDFELGLINGLMMSRFRLMLKLYRDSSDMKRFQYSKVDSPELAGMAWPQRQLITMSCYLLIIVLKGEFMDAVDNYMKRQKFLRDAKKNCKKNKTCRRSMTQVDDLGPEDLESDYFGHGVPKGSASKVPTDPDRVEKLLGLEENSIDLPYEKLSKINVPHDKFTKINDWIRYLANGGIAKNRMKKNNDEEEDYAYFDVTDPKPTTPMPKLVTRTENLTPHPGNSFPDIEDYIDELEHMTTTKKPKIPWGKKGSDYEIKKQARDEFREQMRAGFDPKREGIDIDLYDMM